MTVARAGEMAVDNKRRDMYIFWKLTFCWYWCMRRGKIRMPSGFPALSIDPEWWWCRGRGGDSGGEAVYAGKSVI